MAQEIDLKQRVCSFTGQKSEPYPASEGQPDGWATVVVRDGELMGTYFLCPDALESEAPGVLAKLLDEAAEHRAKQAAEG